MSPHHTVNVGVFVRGVFATACALFAVGGLVFRGDPRWFVASGACGTLWLAWDVLLAHVFRPLGELVGQVMASGGMEGGSIKTRPTLDETIGLLERHLERPTSRQVDINAAVRLEEIYRTIKKDPVQARRVIDTVRARYPEAPELARYSESHEGS